jgi:hypothetical protein
LSLELPRVTTADWTAAMTAMLASGLLVWASVRSGQPWAASLAFGLPGGALLAIQARSCLRSLRRPGRRLLASRDGSLWLQTVGQAPCRATLGLGTRLIGPSVFLDLLAESNLADQRLRTWLTPFDLPTPVLRRCSVVLTRSVPVDGS